MAAVDRCLKSKQDNVVVNENGQKTFINQDITEILDRALFIGLQKHVGHKPLAVYDLSE